MLTFFKSLSLKKTLTACAIAAFILDVLSSFYFAEYWRAQGLSSRFLSLSLIVQGGKPSDFDPHFTTELEGIIEHTASFILLMFLVINSVFYFYLPFKKKWAWQYAFTYTSTAALFCLVTALERPNVSLISSVYNILAIFLYALVSLALWQRKVEVIEKGFRLKTSEQ